MELLLNSKTKKQLTQFVKNPQGSWMFVGAESSGKRTSAMACATRLKVTNENIIIVEPDGKSIGIAQIKDFSKLLSLKSKSSDGWRVVIIDNAHTMTAEAQNAALKLLEEPPERTAIILITHQPQMMLPTVRSRCKEVQFFSPDHNLLTQHLQKQFNLSDSEIAMLLQLSQRRLGLAISLASDKAKLAQIKQLYKLAIDFNKHSLFERLVNTNAVAENPVESFELLLRILQQGLRSALEKGDGELARQLNAAQKRCCELLEYLNANGNAKFAVDIMALELTR